MGLIILTKYLFFCLWANPISTSEKEIIVILICRHGQTEWNLENRKQGWLDWVFSELTELGEAKLKPINLALKLSAGTKSSGLFVAHLVELKVQQKLLWQNNSGRPYVTEITYDDRLKEHGFGTKRCCWKALIQKR